MSGAHHHHHHGHGNHHHRHHAGERATLTTRAALASISMALFLVALKSYATWDTGSVAMLGSLADTTLDLVASLITFFGVRWAAMPADEDHRYGHGKAEALASLVQVILITVSAMSILWRAADGSTWQRPRDGDRHIMPWSHSACSAPTIRHPQDRFRRDHDRSCPLPDRCTAQYLGHCRAAARPDARLAPGRSVVRLRDRRLADVRRVERGEPFGRPADGPRMADG